MGNSVSNINKINDCIVLLTLEVCFQTSTVCCYHPINISFQEDIDPFYNHMNAALSNILAHKILVVARDLNTKVDIRETLHTQLRNEQK